MAVYIGKDQPTGWVVMHYGVKGMRWGKRKARATIIPERFIEEKREVHKPGEDPGARNSREMRDYLNSSRESVQDAYRNLKRRAQNFMQDPTGMKGEKARKIESMRGFRRQQREEDLRDTKTMDDMYLRRYEDWSRRGRPEDERWMNDKSEHLRNDYSRVRQNGPLRSGEMQKDLESRYENVDKKYWSKKGKGPRRSERGSNRRTDR